MKIFSVQQVKEWDTYTIQNESIASIDLMERASSACVQWILNNIIEREFVVFCGPGNNGGDGLAIARLLYKNQKKVRVFIIKSEKYSDDFKNNLERLPIPVTYIASEIDFPVLYANEICIDALFGTGLNKPLNGLAAQLVQFVNESNLKIISIDMPSGMFSDISSNENIKIKATITLSFQSRKLAFMMTENLPFLGFIKILPIQLSKAYELKTKTDFYFIDTALIHSIYIKRVDWVHKYLLGHALIFAGSSTMMGAALLCAKACMRTGAGLVTLSTSEAQMPIVNMTVPEVMTTAETNFLDISHKKNVIVFGPGLIVNIVNEQWLKTILDQWQQTLVIDATGISILLPFLNELKNRTKGTTILTPHQGEFDRLFGRQTDDYARMQEAVSQAKKLNCYIILKAPHTLIACPDGEVYFNSTGNSGMATAGSGDVLAGMISGLLARNYTAKNACILGVYLHGLAGDIAAKKLSKEAMMATDIIEHIGEGYQCISANQMEA